MTRKTPVKSTPRTLPTIDDSTARRLLEFKLESELLDLFGIHRTTLMRWKTGKASMPYSARLLAWLWYGGSCIPHSPDWENWTFGEDCKLYGPYLQDGRTSAEIAAIAWLYPDAIADCERQTARLQKVTRERDWYRSQLGLECRLGLALSRIAG